MRTAQIQRINLLWFLTLGVTALAAALLVYILLIESALGAFSIREATPSLFSDVERPRLLIHKSDASRDQYGILYPDSVGLERYDATLTSWQDILTRRGRRSQPPDTLNDAALTNGEMAGEDILVLPASIVLTEEQTRQIRDFVTAGGSVLISWGAGLYDQVNQWRGWDFMEDTFGIRFHSYVDRGPDNYMASSDKYSGRIPEGFYVPTYLFETTEAARSYVRKNRDNTELQERRRTIANAGFAPLTDYVWFDTLGVTPPPFDHATVEALDSPGSASTDSDSIRVTYYTWIGAEQGESTPYPRTGGFTRRFTLRSNTPITAGIPGGYRAKIQVYSPGVNMQISDPTRASSAGFWYDFATDGPAESSVLHPESGIVYGTVGAGRFVIMGFGPDALGGFINDKEDELVLARLYDNVVGYLKRVPTSWTHDWPSGHDAAVMMAPIIDTVSTDTETLVAFFETQAIPVTYFVSEHATRTAPDLILRLAQQGDVGLFDTRESGAVSSSAFSTGLSRKKSLLDNAVGRHVEGYRSIRRGQLSASVLEALTEDGFTYFLPDSIGRRTTPKIMVGDHVSLTRIGVTTIEQYPSVAIDTARSSVGSLDPLLPEAYRVFDEGGIFRMTPSNNLFASSAGREEFQSFVTRLSQENVWFASGQEVVRWWRLRRGLNTDVEQRSPSRIFVRVSNDNGETAEHATVSIALGRPVTSVDIKPELINLLKQTDDEIENPPHRLTENGTVLELTIKQLKPQQYRIFHVDLFSPELAERFAKN